MENQKQWHPLVVEREHACQPTAFYQQIKQLETQNIQLIPFVAYDENGNMTENSVTPQLWGSFLISVFNIWVREDIHRISIQLFDTTLKRWCQRKSDTEKQKSSRLNASCQACDVFRLCEENCSVTNVCEKSALCEGYKAFFEYSSPYMRVLRDLIKQHRSPLELMAMLR